MATSTVPLLGAAPVTRSAGVKLTEALFTAESSRTWSAPRPCAPS